MLYGMNCKASIRRPTTKQSKIIITSCVTERSPVNSPLSDIQTWANNTTNNSISLSRPSLSASKPSKLTLCTCMVIQVTLKEKV